MTNGRGIIAEFDEFRERVTLTRTRDGEEVNGHFVAGQDVQRPLRCPIVPVRTQDLLKLPQGTRAANVIKLYADEELLILPVPDVITYRGRAWEVQHVDPWTQDGEFYECLCVLRLAE